MAAAFQLPPAPREMAVFDSLVARQTETLILREKVMSLTGDSFEIKLASGLPILKVQGKVMSISGRKSVFDMAGTHLFDIVKEHLHIHTTFAIETPTGQKLMEVKSGFKLLGSKATATFTSSKGAVETLTMKGNWVDYSAEIHDQASNALVARIDRKVLSGRDLLFGQQTYALTVAPNMDMALMAALCICMDEKNNEK
ncbi:tubby C-terminal-like domain-containing protein [Ilyonectria destructans]|nr:tubby C-terminal-like domain-containing protein [Ilyonectria destructans]